MSFPVILFGKESETLFEGKEGRKVMGDEGFAAMMGDEAKKRGKGKMLSFQSRIQLDSGDSFTFREGKSGETFFLKLKMQFLRHFAVCIGPEVLR